MRWRRSPFTGVPIAAFRPLPTLNRSSICTAFSMPFPPKWESIVSAADRAATIRALADSSAAAADFARPGHIFPLRSRKGGVLVRAGHTEASVDLCKLAGMRPVGVLCEVMNDDGTMARRPQLEAFAKRHNLKIGTISDSVEVQATGHGQSGSATPTKRIKIGGEVEASKIVTKVQPIYPDAAKSAGVQGTVNLHAIIGIDGVPLSLQVVNTDVNPDLARASIEAVSKWRYSSTLLNGQPIEVDTNIAIVFSLKR